MTEIDLMRVKETYIKLKNIQISLNELKVKTYNVKTQIDEFKHIKELYEYQIALEQLCKIQTTIHELSNAEILDLASQEIQGTSTNEIYVYMGSYIFDKEHPGLESVKVPDDYADSHWREYRNIESCNGDSNVIVQSCCFQTFQDNHHILFAPSGIDEKAFYLEVRRTFFMLAIESGQAEACKTICKRYLSV